MTTATALRVEIGPGKERFGDDWVTVGVSNVDHKCVWGMHRLPFDDDSVDELYACHVIEHIPWWRTQDAFLEAFRVLKSGGTIELHTIDFRKVVDHYMFGSAGDWEGRADLPYGEFMLWAASRIFSHGKTYGDEQWHKALFDHPYLERCLTRAGFASIEEAGLPRGPEKHGVANMGLKAVKP